MKTFIVTFQTARYQADTRIEASDKKHAAAKFWEHYAPIYPIGITEIKAVIGPLERKQ